MFSKRTVNKTINAAGTILTLSNNVQYMALMLVVGKVCRLDMFYLHWWKNWWGCWRLQVRQLVLDHRLRSDYLRIADMPPGVAGSWMDGEAQLLTLSQKEVETVGSEPCQREFSY
jgi:hypothetical protein